MKLRGLLQLLRPPNLFTVPGDPLCGALLASHGSWTPAIPLAMGISLAAYCFGLVANDLCDIEEDRRERPNRPLPSGAVPLPLAGVLALVFLNIALVTPRVTEPRLGLGAVLLVMTIALYTVSRRKVPLLSPLLMGTCRGLSVGIGAFAVQWQGRMPPALPLIASGFVTLYIIGVATLARNETTDPRMPPLIGALVRGLLFIQAGFCALAGGVGWIAALVLLALWPVSRLVAKSFYGS